MPFLDDLIYDYDFRVKKVQEARVYAEQELNKYREEYEERYKAEAERVILTYADLSFLEKARKR